MAQLPKRRHELAQLLQARRALLLMPMARGGQAVSRAAPGIFARLLGKSRMQVIKHKDRHALGPAQAFDDVAKTGEVARGVRVVAVKEALCEECGVAA